MKKKNTRGLFAPAVLTALLLVLFLALGMVSAASADIELNVEQFGANGSDTQDDQAAIQRALERAKEAEETVIVTIPKGEYYLNGGLTLYSGTKLVCDSGVVMHRTDTDTLMLTNGSDEGDNLALTGRSGDITIQGGTWDGNNVNFNLINLYYAENFQLIDVSFQNVKYSHFMELYDVKNCTIKGCKFSGYTPEPGMETDRDNYGFEAIQIDFYKDGCEDITVTGCTFDGIYSGVGQHHLDKSNAGYTFTNNTFKDMKGTCFNLDGAEDATVTGNTATNVSHFARSISSKGEIVISNNTVKNAGTFLLIKDSEASYDIKGNSVTGDKTGTGLEIINAADISFTGGNALDGFVCGISATDVSNLEITGNTVKNSTDWGLFIKSVSECDINGNSFTVCGQYNIYLAKGTCTGTIEDNTYDLPYGIHNDSDMEIGANRLVVDGKEIPEATGFTIYYHLTENDAASRTTTLADSGDTVILTRNELGFFITGKEFVGWKLWRNDTKTWRVRNSNGKGSWAAEVPEGGEYVIVEDGSNVGDSNAVNFGVELHFYAQWADTDAFKVFYYEAEKEKFSKTITEVTYGTETATELYQDLGFFTAEKRFQGWKAYRPDENAWRVKDESGNISWAKKVPDGGSYALYENGCVLSDEVPAGAELHLYDVQKDDDSFIVYYHLNDDAAAAKKTTKVSGGESTPLLTREELGFSVDGGLFLGWKAYRTDNLTWRVQDAAGTVSWEKELPANGSYALFKDGAKVGSVPKAGCDLHLYAQWESTDIFTVYYHKGDGEKANKTITEVTYGTPAQTELYQDLGFFAAGQRFQGWKAYRSDKASWRVKDAAGNISWAKTLPEGSSYALYESGCTVSEDVPGGTELHFIAVYVEDNNLNVYYHLNDDAAADIRVTKVTNGAPTPIMTLDELEFNVTGSVFLGWKAYRTDNMTWRVQDAAAAVSWDKEVPAGGSYALFKDGASISTTPKAGSDLHLYAQWEATSNFAVYYHKGDGEKANKTVTEGTVGTPVATELYQNLGFFAAGTRFQGWKAFRSDTNSWRVKDAAGNISWAKALPDGGSYALYENGYTVSDDVPGGVELHFYAVQEADNSFVVYYHLNDDANPSKKTTRVKNGKQTTLKTIADLGFFQKGKVFLGWKAYRTDNLSWRAEDAAGTVTWEKTLPEGSVYNLMKDGAKVSTVPKAGCDLHLYAQWEETKNFTVYYHKTDNDKAKKTVTEVTFGTPTKTELYQDLGIFTAGMRFQGWKAYRSDTKSWRVTDAAGNISWEKTLPEGGNYALYYNGCSVSEDVPGGAELHFYAVQEPDNSFIVYYHLNDDAQPAKKTTTVKNGKKTNLRTQEDLGFFQEGKVFLGWKAFRTDSLTWRVENANGVVTWDKKVPSGGAYNLMKDGAKVSSIPKAGSDLHLYAQWEETTTFTVYYHKNDDAKESKTTTEVTWGKKKKTLEYQDLGFTTPGSLFQGWKVYRADTKQWRVKKGSKITWAKTLPSGASYALMTNGVKLSKEVPAGSEIHFYAQWKAVKTFTVYYHQNDKANAIKTVTKITFGKKTKIPSWEELGLKSKGKEFLGWKLYRTDRKQWRVEDKSGNETWEAKLPKGFSYVLYKDQASLSKQVPAGSELHLYAVWGKKK